MNLFKIILLLCPFIWGHNSYSSQDDSELIIKNPFESAKKRGNNVGVNSVSEDEYYIWRQRIINNGSPSDEGSESGFNILEKAQGEVDIGYYVMADEFHRWRARVSGDFQLINFSRDLNWHFGLGMETLADHQNDIHFRLVQVYYQALTGVNWRIGSSVLHLGYRHKCSHGTDRATDSRITIRSGLTGSYQKAWFTRFGRFDIQPGINVYVLGQNKDHTTQARGESFLVLQALWPLSDAFSLVLGSGLNMFLVSSSKSDVYMAWSTMNDWHLEPLFSGRLALRYEPNSIKTDFALSFRQNLDSSIGEVAKKSHLLSLDINFWW